MEKKTIDDLKSCAGVLRAFSYLSVIAVVALGIKMYYEFFSAAQVSLNNSYQDVQRTINPTTYYLIVIVIAIIVAIRLYAMSADFAYKACMLEKVTNIKDKKDIETIKEELK